MDLNTGVRFGPVFGVPGAAKKVPGGCPMNVAEGVPCEVTGVPVTLKTEVGKINPTEVTPADWAIVTSVEPFGSLSATVTPPPIKLMTFRVGAATAPCCTEVYPACPPTFPPPMVEPRADSPVLAPAPVKAR